MRTLPVLAIALLVLSSVVGAATTAPARPSSDAAALGLPVGTAQMANTSTSLQTIHVIDIPSPAVSRTSIQGRHIDLGPSLTFSANATRNRLRTLTLVEQITSADSATERRTLVQRSLDGIESRVDSLRADQRRVVEAYGRDEISARELLVRLAEIDREARALDNRQERIERLASRAGIQIDPGRLGALERDIETFTGPVRSHAIDVLRGDTSPDRFYVAVGPDSVVLSVVDGGVYLREAYRGDLRSPGGSMGPEDAWDIAAESYPVIWNLSRQSTQVVGSGPSYVVRVAHMRGELVAFIDSGTRTVFKEFQRRPLETMATRPGASSTKDGLRLTVNTTYPGGPARVSLTDAETGDPVSANVTVGPSDAESDFVGYTGDDGSLWTLEPGSEFTVTAIRGNSVVMVTLSPGARPRVHPTNASV